MDASDLDAGAFPLRPIRERAAARAKVAIDGSQRTRILAACRPSPRLALALLLATMVAVRLCAQLAASASTIVIVVRHAEKDTIPRDDPELTAAGRARAKALVRVLSDAHVQAVIATQLRRTQETARAVAAARGLVVETVPRREPIEDHARDVAAAVRRHAGQTVLVVGHGETVGPIIHALGGPAIGVLCASMYSSLFVLLIDGPRVRLLHATYGVPSKEPPDCSNLR